MSPCSSNVPVSARLVLAATGLLALAGCEKNEGLAPLPAPKPPLREESAEPLPPDETPRGKLVWTQDPAAFDAARPGTEREFGFKLLYFRTPREFGCGLLERFAFGDEKVAAFVMARAVARHADLGRDRALARAYDVTDVPALVVLDAEGGYAGALVGYRPPHRLLKDLAPLLEAGEDKHKRGAELEARAAKAQGAERIAALDDAAELNMQRRFFVKAETQLRELLATKGIGTERALPALYARHARALAALGHPERAAESYTHAIETDALKLSAEDLAFERALALAHGGRHDLALPHWESFLKEFPKSARRGAAAHNLVLALTETGRSEEAAVQIARWLREPLGAETEASLRALMYALDGSTQAVQALRMDQQQRQAIADALADGRDLVKKFGCLECHLLIEPQLQPERQSCVQCHLLIRNLEQDAARHDEVLKAHPHFFRNCTRVRHLLRAPNLFGAGARIREDWLRGFLADPHDVRPHLEESMLRLDLAPREADALVRYLRAIAVVAGQTPPEASELRALPPADKDLIARGWMIFEAKHCYGCHQFGNVRFAADQGEWNWLEGRAEAPNLRFVRDRLTPRTAAEWIRDPQAMNPGTRMPAYTLGDADIEALVAFLFHGEAGSPAKPEPRRRLAAKSATWEEVNAAVFQETCIHCHTPDGTGGAGNDGGFGFRAHRLDLTSYAGIRRGSLQADGTRLDILKPHKEGEAPPILERVRRRIEENRRDLIAPFADPLTDFTQHEGPRERPGMPLGHPALTPEQLAILEAWLKAGAPGPQPEALDGTERNSSGMMSPGE